MSSQSLSLVSLIPARLSARFCARLHRPLQAAICVNLKEYSLQSLQACGARPILAVHCFARAHRQKYSEEYGRIHRLSATLINSDTGKPVSESYPAALRKQDGVPDRPAWTSNLSCHASAARVFPVLRTDRVERPELAE
jgi:hypothetical protein